MFIKNWKREILTVPNLLSLFRLVLIPVYIHLYLNAHTSKDYLSSGLILAISCLSDMIDGRIARSFGMISNVGKVLDPFADKATQLALTLCLSRNHPVLRPVLVLFVVKECFQLIACILFFHNGKVLPGALPAGKICTTVLFISLILMVLFPLLPEYAVDLMAAVDAVFLFASLVCYILAYYGKNKKIQDLN